MFMCADHNGLCIIGPTHQYNALYLDLRFLVYIVSGPDFEILFWGLEPYWSDKCLTPPSRAIFFVGCKNFLFLLP